MYSRGLVLSLAVSSVASTAPRLVSSLCLDWTGSFARQEPTREDEAVCSWSPQLVPLSFWPSFSFSRCLSIWPGVPAACQHGSLLVPRPSPLLSYLPLTSRLISPLSHSPHPLPSLCSVRSKIRSRSHMIVFCSALSRLRLEKVSRTEGLQVPISRSSSSCPLP